MSLASPEEPRKWFLPEDGVVAALSEAERIVGPEAHIWRGRHKGIEGHWVKYHTHQPKESEDLKQLKAQSAKVLQAAAKRKREPEGDSQSNEDTTRHGTDDQRHPKKSQTGHQALHTSARAHSSVALQPDNPKADRRKAQLPPELHPNQSFDLDCTDAPAAAATAATEHKSKAGKPSRLETLAESCGWQVGAKKFLWDTSSLPSHPVTEVKYLGRGRSGVADQVKIDGFDKTMVRKRIDIYPVSGKRAKKCRLLIKTEVENLKKLYHTHIVKVLGYYEELRGDIPTSCILMFPAGNHDLGRFLSVVVPEGTTAQKSMYVSWVQSWFSCLASALSYMHTKGIHHEDIKPTNIIHREGAIYFTDFSSSRRLRSSEETSTATPGSVTPQFAAPEAISDSMEKHGSKSDVFSLGLVFVEMTTVFKRTVAELREFVFKKGKERYYQHLDRLPLWFSEKASSKSVVLWDGCLQRMLAPERDERPSPREVVDILASDQFRGVVKCTCACLKPKEGNSSAAITDPPKVVAALQSPATPTKGLPVEEESTVTLYHKPERNQRKKERVQPAAETSASLAVESKVVSEKINSTTKDPGSPAKPAIITRTDEDAETSQIPPRKKGSSKKVLKESKEAAGLDTSNLSGNLAKTSEMGTVRGGKRSKSSQPTVVAKVEKEPARHCNAIEPKSMEDAKYMTERNLNVKTEPARRWLSSPNIRTSMDGPMDLDERQAKKENATRQPRLPVLVNEQPLTLMEKHDLVQAAQANRRCIEIVESVETSRGHSPSPRPHGYRSQKKHPSIVYSTTPTETPNAGSSSSLPLTRRHTRSEHHKDASPSQLSRIMSWGGGLSPFPRL